MNQNESILRDILHSLAQMNATPSRPSTACVFDLDSTLFCVSTRTQAILRELAQQKDFKNQFKNEAEKLASVSVMRTDWGIKQALLRLQFPFSNESIQAIRDFWRDSFFSNDYLDHDVLYDHSNLFVQLCEKYGSEIFYLTGRSEQLMKEGSLRQLKRHSFPLKSDDHLIMKGIQEEQDEDFKLNRLKRLKDQFDQIYFFENEPVIIKSIHEQLPDVHIVFMDSTHSARAEAPSHLPRIDPSSYSRVKEKK